MANWGKMIAGGVEAGTGEYTSQLSKRIEAEEREAELLRQDNLARARARFAQGLTGSGMVIDGKELSEEEYAALPDKTLAKPKAEFEQGIMTAAQEVVMVGPGGREVKVPRSDIDTYKAQGYAEGKAPTVKPPSAPTSRKNASTGNYEEWINGQWVDTGKPYPKTGDKPPKPPTISSVAKSLETAGLDSTEASAVAVEVEDLMAQGLSENAATNKAIQDRIDAEPEKKSKWEKIKGFFGREDEPAVTEPPTVTEPPAVTEKPAGKTTPYKVVPGSFEDQVAKKISSDPNMTPDRIERFLSKLATERGQEAADKVKAALSMGSISF